MKNTITRLVIGLALAIVGILIVIQFKDLVSPSLEDAAIIVADTTALESPAIQQIIPDSISPPKPKDLIGANEIETEWLAITSEDINEYYKSPAKIVFSPSRLIVNGIETIFHKVEQQTYDELDSWTFYDEKMEEVGYIIIRNEVTTFCHYLGSSEKIKFYSNSKEEVENFHNYHLRK